MVRYFLLISVLFSEFCVAQDIDSLYQSGSDNFARGLLNAAFVDFTKVISQSPSNAQAYLKRGRVRQAGKDTLGAIYDYTQAIRYAPDSVDGYYYRAMIQRDRGDYLLANLDFSKALSLKPNNSDIFYHRGISWVGLNEYEKAINDFNAVSTASPDYADALYHRGYCYFQLQKPEIAVKDLTLSLSITPSAEAYYQRGLIKKFYKKYTDALLDFDEALKLNSDYTAAIYERGVLRVNVGNKEGYKDLTKAALGGYEPAATALKTYKYSLLDSMLVYQAPEIIVEAMKPEYQGALRVTLQTSQVATTALSFFIGSPVSDILNRSKLLKPDSDLGDNTIAARLPGMATVDETRCNERTIQNASSSQVNIYCIIFLLRKQVNLLKDDIAETYMKDLEDLVVQIDNIRISPGGSDTQRIRELLIMMQQIFNKLQARVSAIKKITSLEEHNR